MVAILQRNPFCSFFFPSFYLVLNCFAYSLRDFPAHSCVCLSAAGVSVTLPSIVLCKLARLPVKKPAVPILSFPIFTHNSSTRFFSMGLPLSSMYISAHNFRQIGRASCRERV